MTTTKIKESVRLLECAQDIPPKVRQEWLTDALRNITHPLGRKLVLQGIQRLRRANKRPKYPVLYSVQPLLDLAFGLKPRAKGDLPLVDKLLLQLRLTTLMRSGDAANLVWAIFDHEGEFYVKCTAKSGQVQVFRVSSSTRETLLAYVHAHRHHPALFLFRYVKEPHFCLTAERLAKRLLVLMEAEGIETRVFKAHSLRGATATHLLKQGVPHSLVQARGAWSSSQTLDLYYNRLHQAHDWEALLQGEHVSGRQPTACAVLPPSCPPSGPDEGRGSGGNKEESTAQVVALTALGVLRPLYGSLPCPSCGLPTESEAAYRCCECQSVYHVRCMGHFSGVGARQYKYKTTCYLCSLGGVKDSAAGRARRPSKADGPDIEDPMGVCAEL